MFSKELIDKLLELNTIGDNCKDDDPEWFAGDALKRKLVEAKMLIDRWGNCADHIIFHPSKKEFVRSKLGSDLSIGSEGIDLDQDQDSIWGTKIHYLNDCPPDKGIMISLRAYMNGDTTKGRNLSVFPM
jgi:hypothetical protein